MQFRVLGGHQVESADGRPTAFLIDDHIAVDAGGLLGSLSIAQQDAIDTLIVTHYHYDHIRDLPFLGLGAVETGRQIDVYCSHQVRDALAQHLMSAPIWPLNLFAGLDPSAPTFRHHAVVPGAQFSVGGCAALPIDNRHHAVPVIGYQFTAPSGRRLVYTGDTGPGIRDTWPLVEPDVLITEVTYPTSMGDMGSRAGHLTPATLEQELVALRDAKGSLPRVVVCHLNQRWEGEIKAELEKVARRLQAPIEVADEGMLIDL